MMSSDLTKIYDDLWQQSLTSFEQNKYELDFLIKSENDTRRGLTLLVRLTGTLADRISDFLEEARKLEPDQYYYPSGDFHLTVMSVITCVKGFEMSQINPDEYAGIIGKSVNNIKNFKINFRGITASPSCIMIQGFPENDQLNTLRNNLRTHFKQSDTKNSIDSRYAIQTAHSTMIRFQKSFREPKKFLDFLIAHKKCEFGTLEVQQLEFVFNDWYQRKANTKKLFSINLDNP